MKRKLLILFTLLLVAGCSTVEKLPLIGKSDEDKSTQSNLQQDGDKEEDTGDQEIVVPKPTGNLRYTIKVTSFENKSNWVGQWNLGDGFTEILVNALQESGWFIVIGDTEMRDEAMAEQDFGISGRAAVGKKTPQIGRMTPAQLLIKGVITHAQDKTVGGGGGINVAGIHLGGSGGRAEINMTMYIVNAETGQVVASQNVIGKSERKGLSLGYFGRGRVTGGGKAYKNDNMGKACENAVAQGLLFLIEQLEHIPWEGSVALVTFDGSIVINRGAREGVQVGNKFNVGHIQEIVDNDTGEVLDRSLIQVGVIEVASVKEKVAYCIALAGGENIEKGMTIYPTK
jgi:curli biogenesis system outer membrane secretion channel CsgG